MYLNGKGPSKGQWKALEECDAETHETAHSRLERSALIETCAKSQYIYGSWDTVFGAWCRRADDMSWRPVVPNFPLVDRFGQPFGCEDALDHVSLDPDLDYPSDKLRSAAQVDRKAVSHYAKRIPAIHRALVGRLAYARGQWLLLGAIRADPSIADMVRAELDATGRSYLDACLILGRFACLDCRQLAGFVRDALTKPRHEVLSQLSGVLVAKSAVKLLNKYDWLGHVAADDLRNLFIAANHPKQGPILRQRPKIGICLVRVSGHIESPFERAGWLRTDVRLYPCFSATAIQFLKYAAACYRRMEATESIRAADWRERALSAIERSHCPETMHRRLRAILNQSLRPEATWNAGPWAGSPDFQMVMRAQELIKIAKTFQNCVRDRAVEYATGHAFLYVTRSTRSLPATLIEIRCSGSDEQWSVSDCQTKGKATANARALKLFMRKFELATGHQLTNGLEPAVGHQ
jgi:hypothetical protein